MVLPLEYMNAGDNVLWVQNNANPNYYWGLRLGALRDEGAELGTIHPSGTTDDEVTYLVPVFLGARTMEFTCFDVDYADEVDVWVNGLLDGQAGVTGSDAWDVTP